MNSVKPVYTIVRANGKPAVLLNINRQPDSNTVEVADEVHDEIEAIRKDLPRGNRVAAVLRSVGDRAGVHRERARRDSDRAGPGVHHHGAVPARLGHVAGRGAGDSGHHRGSPSSRCACWAQTFNLMTLGGLAAAVGLVIDDAIVVVENIVLHRDQGQSRAEAIRSALSARSASRWWVPP